MSQIPKAKSSIPKPSLAQVATATGSQLDLLAGKSERSISRQASTLESTDFKIGDRVWVGGTKAGVIRYIGVTKFAPGDWVGVELDEAQGKNDGSVAGETYFSCPPNHGVFSRMNRLSRKQSVVAQETLSSMRRQSKVGAGTSPAGSMAELRKGSVSPTLSPAESTSSLAAGAGPLEVGDRIIVASSMAGTKTGTLRYLGPTDFAQGEWAGIELDAAIGRNDGSVNGKRYFQCPSNFGLFAPLHKVTKSPKMKMMKPSSITPRLRRESSNLSDMSTASSVAFGSRTPAKKLSMTSNSASGGLVTPATVKSNTSALKDQLREKEQHIEQLLKERDLERAEVAKAASQTDEVEAQLVKVQQELDALKSEKGDDAGLKDQLEEERKKTEDLQFRLEESEILRTESNKGGAEVEEDMKNLRAKIISLEEEGLTLRNEREVLQKALSEETEKVAKAEKQSTSVQELSKEKRDLQDKISVLSKELAQEQKRGENLESEANKYFEAEEQLMVAKEELLVFKKKFELTESLLEKEKKSREEMLNSQQSEGKQASEKIFELETTSREKEEEILDLKHQLEKFKVSNEEIESKFSKVSQELGDLRKNYQELSKKSDKDKSSLTDNEEELAKLALQLDTLKTANSSLEKEKSSNEAQILDLQATVSNKVKENNSLKSQIDQHGSEADKELKIRNVELETLKETLKCNEAELDLLKGMIKSKDEAFDVMKGDLSVSEKNTSTLIEIKASLEKEIDSLKENNNASQTEIARLQEMSSKKEEAFKQLQQSFKELQDENDNINTKIRDIEGDQKNRLEENEASFALKLAAEQKSAKALQKELENVKKDIKEKEKDHEEKQRNLLSDHQTEMAKVNRNLENSTARVEELESKIKSFREEAINKDSKSEEYISHIEKLESDLKKRTSDFEKQISSINESLVEKDKEITDLKASKKDLEADLKSFEATKQNLRELSIEFNDCKEKIDALKSDLTDKDKVIEELNSTSCNSSDQLEKLRNENIKFSKDVNDYKEEKSTLSQALQKLQAETDQLKQNHVKEKERITTESENEIEAMTKKIATLKLEKEESDTVKKQLTDQLEQSAEASKKALQELKMDKEKLMLEHESEVSSLQIEAQKLKNKCTEADEKLESINWKKSEIERQLERVKKEFDEEMSEMVDVVNDLKLKEEELNNLENEMKNKNNKIDDLCKQMLNQEQNHKDMLRKREKQAEDEVKMAESKLDEAKNQINYLKEQMGGVKVECDLQIQKHKMEFECKINELNGALTVKDGQIDKLKDDVSTKESEIEFLKEELQTKKDELDDLASDLDIKEASFSNECKEVDERHKEEIEELIVKNETLNLTIGNLKETIARQTSEFDSKMDDLVKTKKFEISDLKDKLSEKEVAVMDLQANIKTFEEKIHELEVTCQGDAKLANTKIEKISGENEGLRRTKYELETSVKNITMEKDHIKQISDDLNIRIVEYEVQVKEMRSQYESLQMEFQKQTIELKERSDRASLDQGSLTDLYKLLESERTRVDELQVTLNNTESERDQLDDQVKSLIKKSQEFDRIGSFNESLRNEVEELKKKNEFLFEEIAKERLRLEAKMETIAEELDAKKKEYSIKEFEVTQLLKENTDLTSYKRQVLTLEQEKRDLESQLVTVVAEARAAKTSSTPTSVVVNPSHLSDETQAQVDFLNSVIVDMQKKNDKLKAQLEIYETAGILDESQEFIFNGVSSRAVPPRMFCDICDQFDLHETEDCPTQTTPLEQQEESLHTKSKGKRGVERPYCETCEIFGHSTEDCDDGETF